MDLPLRLPDLPPSFGEVTLRAFRHDDVPMLLDLATDPYVPLIGTLPAHADEAQAAAYISRQHDRLRNGAGWSFCVALAATDEAVGQAGIWLADLDRGRATAGYVVAPAFRGRGLAAQALRALTSFGWSLSRVDHIELFIEPWNVASLRTAEAAGYRRAGLRRHPRAAGGRDVDMLLFASRRRGSEAPTTRAAHGPA